MKLRRNNHFLPVCYQKGFTDSQGLVWVKFAKKTEPEHRNPLSVGKVRDLYIRARNGVKDDQIEDFFQKSVESPFSALSHRIKEEREKLSEISGKEIGALARFVASQMFRTIAYKQCLDAQAGRALEARDFHRNMLRQMWTLMNMWIKSLPQVRFFTTLPYIGERFITGDNPVLVVYMKDNPIWEPTVTPQKGITNLNEVLNNPNHVFQVSLSPYICASIQCRKGGKPSLPPQRLEPPDVRTFNNLICGQSSIFTLARDQESLTHINRTQD